MESIKTQGNFIAYSGESRRAAFALEEDLVLFEAVPDLLEALDELCNWFGEDRSDWDDWEGVDEVLDNAQNAIAKATGGE